mmetsp:Transcript_7292/g.26864  ORF Transcript_7292/g.26864 Transcript_7292/m.26864 type:complete len:301 (-) Transcript_7292:595-1497(-)
MSNVNNRHRGGYVVLHLGPCVPTANVPAAVPVISAKEVTAAPKRVGIRSTESGRAEGRQRAVAKVGNLVVFQGWGQTETIVEITWRLLQHGCDLFSADLVQFSLHALNVLDRTVVLRDIPNAYGLDHGLVIGFWVNKQLHIRASLQKDIIAIMTPFAVNSCLVAAKLALNQCGLCCEVHVHRSAIVSSEVVCEVDLVEQGVGPFPGEDGSTICQTASLTALHDSLAHLKATPICQQDAAAALHTTPPRVRRHPAVLIQCRRKHWQLYAESRGVVWEAIENMDAHELQVRASPSHVKVSSA